jgi:hypothetical protein
VNHAAARVDDIRDVPPRLTVAAFTLIVPPFVKDASDKVEPKAASSA